MLKKPLLKAFLIKALIINIIMSFFGITFYAQVIPDVADVTFGDSNYLVVWEAQHGKSDICGARVDQSGNVLDTTGFSISTEMSDELSPTVAFDGTYFLVVWDEDDGISGVRVDQSGVVIDTSEI